MAAIHLIKNAPGLPQITLVERGSDIYRSGYWVIAEKTASALVGGNIYFHENRAAPSFFGGLIKNAEKEDQGKYAGRIVFIFKFVRTCKDVVTPNNGWSQEMKIILKE